MSLPPLRRSTTIGKIDFQLLECRESENLRKLVCGGSSDETAVQASLGFMAVVKHCAGCLRLGVRNKS